MENNFYKYVCLCYMLSMWWFMPQMSTAQFVEVLWLIGGCIMDLEIWNVFKLPKNEKLAYTV